ncbi:ECF transporter S component [Floricoccus penangensis]|uniref:Riboflavin transporter n=1 Tax=Floricoccus penangensis TaxID=1859475 RepID=A0A9Q5JF59_9LACT|nr:ECF transporter S component [Floricoccus penangensis]OFI46078.1 ECF transporter S component [Floricoccus penangensis]
MKDTKRMAHIAILSAISFVLMLFPQFPLIPGADFLKVEFSILPILVGYLMFDLKAAYMILFIRSLLKFFLNNEGVNTWIGLPMNILAIGMFVTIFAFISKRDFTRQRYIVASICATVAMTLTMLAMNYFYAIPLYAKFAGFDIKQFIGVGKYLLAMVTPFNLLQGALYSVSFYILVTASKHLPMLEKNHK